MKNKFIHFYYDLFDKKIFDSAIVVLIIGLLIVLVGFISSKTSHNNLNSSILDLTKIEKNYNNTLKIGDTKYKVSVEKE